MNRSLIASLALAATALTFGAGAFAQTGSTAPIQKDVAKLKADKAAVANDKLALATDKKIVHADKKQLHADKKAAVQKLPS